jgi:hypothetical protein
MLILEVTNAQDQLNLLKKIINSTWSAIAAEAAAAAAAKQQRAAASAAKPRVRRASIPVVKAAASKPTTPKSPKSAAINKATVANAANSADKAAAAVVQHGAANQMQSQPQQPRRVYPSSTAKPKPIARLGRVAVTPAT